MSTRVVTGAIRSILHCVLGCVFFSVFPAATETFGSCHGTCPADTDHAQQQLNDVSRVPASARKALFVAQDFRDAGDFESAARTLSDCLLKYPDQDHHLLRFHLANHLSRADHPEEALQQYLASVELEPNYAQAWLNLGDLAFGLADYDRAATAFYRGWQLSADQPPFLLYYAAASHMMKGHVDAAVPLLEKLVAENQKNAELDWFRALISCRIELDEARHAQNACDRMLDLHGDNPDAWILAGQVAANDDDYHRAAIHLAGANYIRPLNGAQLRQLGNLLRAVGIPALACEYYSAALTDSASADEFENLAAACLAAHDPDQAQCVLSQAIAHEPTAKLWSLLGDIHYLDNKFGEAMTAFANCAGLDPQNGRAHLMVGYCALKTGHSAGAISSLKKATEFPEHRTMATELLKQAHKDMEQNSDATTDNNTSAEG